jgi:hypothetical protein
MNFFLNYKFVKIFVTKTLGLDPDLGKLRNPDQDSVNLVYKQCFFCLYGRQQRPHLVALLRRTLAASSCPRDRNTFPRLFNACS